MQTFTTTEAMQTMLANTPFSTEEVATICGVSTRAVERWLSGTIPPRPWHIYLMAQAIYAMGSWHPMGITHLLEGWTKNALAVGGRYNNHLSYPRNKTNDPAYRYLFVGRLTTLAQLERATGIPRGTIRNYLRAAGLCTGDDITNLIEQMLTKRRGTHE
jgi:hypothetical protein